MLSRNVFGFTWENDDELEFLALQNNNGFSSMIIQSVNGKLYGNGVEITITRSGYSLNPLQLYNFTGNGTVYKNNEVVTWG